ncbi:MAG: hypothetical protein K8R60_18595 [Burkholderiales bacterium]|nr:hypothetical protein [Burkholderiales bacterium]
MSEYPYATSQGSSAPVAIVLALALAATVGVSAQNWDARAAAKAQPPGAAAAFEAADTRDGASLVRLLVDWARGRTPDCAAAASSP